MHGVDLPAANGREPRGRGPAVVLQDDHYGGHLPVVSIVPLTTARAATRLAGTTCSRPRAENGLWQASVALVLQWRAMERGRLQKRIGTVSMEELNAMCEEPGKLTGRRVSPDHILGASGQVGRYQVPQKCD
jgi:mRNA-degrading endonuclease toxin of MazEF toxin-antitoxin module